MDSTTVKKLIHENSKIVVLSSSTLGVLLKHYGKPPTMAA